MKNPTLNRWTLELNEYNIVFKHIAGKENIVTDAISKLKQKEPVHRTHGYKRNPQLKASRTALRMSLQKSTISNQPKV